MDKSKQVGGKHYSRADYQHWDFVEALKLSYLEGCLTKYLVRYRDKDGLKDLEKALHYAERMEIERLQFYRINSHFYSDVYKEKILSKLRVSYDIPFKEMEIIRAAVFWDNEDDLENLIELVKDLIKFYNEDSCDATGKYVNQD